MHSHILAQHQGDIAATFSALSAEMVKLKIKKLKKRASLSHTNI